MGDLIKTPYSEITATLELLDRFGVTADDLAALRKDSSWRQSIVGSICKADQFLWALLEIEATAKKAGFTEADWRVLAQSEEKLRLVLSLVRPEAKQEKNIIDCDANPFTPDGWKVVDHKKAGQLIWDPTRISLYLSEGQKNGKVIKGKKLCKELKNMPVLNANVLDYLLANPHLIPEEWKDKYVYFWGTIYRDSDGDLRVRCLDWYVHRWYWLCHWLGNDWRDVRPAALLASN